MTDYAAKTGYQSQTTAESYDERRFTSLRGRLVNAMELGAVRRALTRAAPIETLLDLPCGTGRLAHSLAGQGLSVHGADISVEMLQQARLKLGANPSPNGADQLVRCDAEALPYASKSFDCIVSLRFMCHLPPDTRRSILREMRRITSCWLIVAFYKSDAIFQAKRAIRRSRCRPFSRYPVSWNELDGELSDAGLKREATFPVARFHLSETHILLLLAD